MPRDETGLGLYVSKGIIEANATITAANNSRYGKDGASMFTLALVPNTPSS